MEKDEYVIPRLEPGETVGPFAIHIPREAVIAMEYEATLPPVKRWLWRHTFLWRWL